MDVAGSSAVVAALEAARDMSSPVILQLSQGGAAYFAGEGVSNAQQAASISEAIAAAHYIRGIAPSYNIPVVLHTDHCSRSLLELLDGMLDADEEYVKEHGKCLFSSHMIDLSAEEVTYNLETTAQYLKRAAPMKQWLEMEIGITGGEEDGVNNESVDNDSLHTQPEIVLEIYELLAPISPYFSIAAGFGNVHGVYKPGNVKLHPELLRKHQNLVSQKHGSKGGDKPIALVLHGGPGSTKEEYKEAISYGVVKVNVDTDMQYAMLGGGRHYIREKSDYLNAPVGNPNGEDKPNKAFFDPRVWLRAGEVSMKKRVQEAIENLGSGGKL